MRIRACALPCCSLALHEMTSSLPRSRTWRVVPAAALLLASSSALANGRFPRAERLVEDPTNPDHLALAATYGIVTTTDRGRSWYHICEASFADLASYTGDPLLDFTNDGAMLVGVQQTLNASRDGCRWTATLGGGSTFRRRLHRAAISASHHRRASRHARERHGRLIRYGSLPMEQRIGSQLGEVPGDTAYTVDVDPAQPSHIYVTTVADNVGQLLRSDDEGRTFTAHPIPHTDIGEAPYLAALHPSEPAADLRAHRRVGDHRRRAHRQ